MILKDDFKGFEYIYDIPDDEVMAFLQKHGERDEMNNVVLSAPVIAALPRFSPESVIQQADEFVRKLSVPFIIVNSDSDMSLKEVDGTQLYKCTNDQLQEYLSLFGGYRAYLDAELAKVEARRKVLEMMFDEGLSKTLYELTMQYRQEDGRKPTKEALRGESLSKNNVLKRTRQEMIQSEALVIRIVGLRDSIKCLYDTVSRLVTLRALDKEVIG